MAVDSHIHRLEQLHQELENELEHIMAHNPSVNDGEIAAIKRRKLRIKDRIAELKRQLH